MSQDQQIMENLKVILGNDVESNIVAYICSMKSEDDFKEFMENILDQKNSAHVNAYNAIKYAIFGSNLKQKKTSHSISQSNVDRNSSGRNSNQNNSSLAVSTLSSSSSKTQPNQGLPEKSTSVRGSTYGKKGKTKFKNIQDFEEKKRERKGRYPCGCMGQEHEFLNNCLFCGRIHCYKEGIGPCLFCGIEIKGRDESRGAANTKPIMRPKQNKIFDDDNDYFKIKSKKTGDDKHKLVVALDFASRKVIETTEGDMKLKKMLLEDSMRHLKKVEEVYSKLTRETNEKLASKSNRLNDELVDLLIQMRHKKPIEKEELVEEDNKMPITNDSNIFDEELIAKVDQGLCLSMHQPYASLLVAGVKRHEGRVWPTDHRGRLWIAAAAKQPREEDITALEDFYKKFHKDPTLKLPKEYPTGCLLGCVTVEDCLDQESYQKTFGSNEESSSPYVMICSNPIILPVFYPISGKHKIYPLDKELHKCAKMALHYAKYV